MMPEALLNTVVFVLFSIVFSFYFYLVLCVINTISTYSIFSLQHADFIAINRFSKLKMEFLLADNGAKTGQMCTSVLCADW